MKRLFGFWHPRRGLQIGLLMGVVAGTTATSPLQVASADGTALAPVPSVTAPAQLPVRKSSRPQFAQGTGDPQGVGTAKWSTNWAGYVAGPGPGAFGSVWAVWNQPFVDCAGDLGSTAAFWVGLDGGDPNHYPTNSLEQIGVDTVCDNKQVHYRPWLELVEPAVPSAYPVEYLDVPPYATGGNYPYWIDAWDEMAASVVKVKEPGCPAAYPEGYGCKFHVHLEDRSTTQHHKPWQFDKEVFAGPYGWGLTAEVVVEKLQGVPIGNYATSAFNSAAVDGHPFWSFDAMHMVCPNLAPNEPNSDNWPEVVGVSVLEPPYNAFFWTGWHRRDCQS